MEFREIVIVAGAAIIAALVLRGPLESRLGERNALLAGAVAGALLGGVAITSMD